MNEKLRKYQELNLLLVLVMRKIRKVKEIIAFQREDLLLPGVAEYRSKYLKQSEDLRRRLLEEQFKIADELEIDHVLSVMTE